MKNKVFYLYPEVEGAQYYVCWGIAKARFSVSSKKTIKNSILEGLKNIKNHENRWISQRSFHVFLGEDAKYFWVAVPRQLTAKAMKLLGVQLAAHNPKIVITSFENPFGEKMPFEPIISYDRGFIFDSTSIEKKLAEQSEENIVNI